MNKENRKKFILPVVIIIIIGIVVIKIIDNNYQKDNVDEIKITNIVEESDDKSDEKIKVYVTGEVKNQGVIELDEGSRIVDAIEKAGGQTAQANLKNVNLAYTLEDGQKIYIPNINEPSDESSITDNDGVVDSEEKESVVNINKASESELQQLKGIGQALASSIVQYREENGKFKAVEDIKNVPGIGENKFENIKENIKVK